MTHDIEHPLDKNILFPNVCVVCEKKNPGHQVELTFLEEKFSALQAASTMIAGDTYHVEKKQHAINSIPTCVECAETLKKQHARLKIISYGLWSLSVLQAFLLPVSLWWKAALFIGLLILPVVISLIFPPAIDATISNKVATFSFTSQNVANAFKKINEK